MRRYEFYIPDDLFDMIKLLAKQSGLSMPKMIVHLLEVGYLKILQSKSSNLEISHIEPLD